MVIALWLASLRFNTSNLCIWYARKLLMCKWVRFLVGVSNVYVYTVACVLESILLSQPGITTVVIFTQKTWCCWSTLLTHPLMLYKHSTSQCILPQTMGFNQWCNPQKIRHYKERSRCRAHQNTNQNLDLHHPWSRGHVLGRGKRRETRRISTWCAVRHILVMKTVRVKNVTTNWVVRRIRLRITNYKVMSVGREQVRVEARRFSTENNNIILNYCQGRVGT